MSDFNYMSARLGAMRSRLLTRKTYEELIACPDVPSVLESLLNGPYGPVIESAGEAADAPARIEEGLRRDWSATLVKLFRMSEGDPRESVGMLLGYWDAANIKTILRGKQFLLSPEEIVRSLIPTGRYDEPALAELARQPSLQAVVERLRTLRSPHAAPLMEALRDYHEPGDLHLLELTLDRSYFLKPGRMPSDQPSMESLRTFLSFLVDKTNLMTAFKMAEERLILTERERYFLPGGTSFSYPTFVLIRKAGGTGGLAGALAQARSTRFGAALADLGEPPRGIGMLALVEGRLELAVRQRARRIRRSDPSGLGAVLSFLWDKIHELMNLRMILRGRLMNLPGPALWALLSV